MTTEQLYELYKKHPNVKTDSRILLPGDLFFALSGPNFNGNHFAQQAISSGASYAIVDEEIESEDGRIIQVENVLHSLQMLAKFHRETFNIPFIAITGSNGKTTTKELVNAVLSSQYKIYTTEGNLNNHIGVPLTLLSIKNDAEMAVIEMGANHQKEIESYCHYAEPTYGIITNCGKAHLEGFNGIEGVKKGKGELYDYLRNNKGAVFLYNEYDYLQKMSNGIEEVITYGTVNSFVTGHALPSKTFLKVQITSDHSVIINTQLVGDYNLPNVLCAVAVGRYFNISTEQIKVAIENYIPQNSRSQLILKNSNQIILDAYNANPTSMNAAIKNIAKIDSKNKILMLGSMKEMGDASEDEHQAVVDLINQYSWHKVILVGNDFCKTKHSYHCFESSEEAAEWTTEQHFTNCYFLIKGSRSMQMEKILNSL